MRLVVPRDFAGVALLADALRAFVRAHALPPRAAYAVQLVTEEIATNVVKHAHDGPGARDFRVELEAEEGAVVVRFDDGGKPFDPTRAPPAGLDVPLTERGTGGLGLHLVRGHVDALRYRREGGRNRVELRIGTAV